ncbi:MAG: hypothetical protein HN633_10595 [Candidatus Marinimicrobia bacterium]|jgi:hypothetical protein|nr:hypothetical protein [Candidatus Neomarinimicrobiota bacterium]MBT5467069.1 hypothetical protein [Candidatus Neomarinimicrobiota bacterium]MBT7199169.1 hypothetical protein [Candidatus Neomarinimicrobiota bacterium]MBT7579203.1 hypothetical protein [Candidatus Neomarinimicrobiota bacterium]MBT7829908.1 hypothetical protein [Candidatus Neomarinimicrobiota bacterium]
MYLEKNNSPGRIINLDHVASMDWDKELSVEFILANGQTVTWRYKTEEEQMEDLDKVGKLLHRTHKLISVELDQE